jgi:hypothetical protein
MNKKNGTIREGMELGKRTGLHQAFDLVAKRCTAAAAETLKRLRDSGEYKKLGLTWEQFCEQELGVSRALADRQLLYLERYGIAYFRVAEVVPLSESTYKLIASSVHDECIEVSGESIPITRENRKRVAEAVKTIRQRHAAPVRKEESRMASLRQRVEDLVTDACEAAKLTDQRMELLKVLFETRSTLERLTNELRIRAVNE